MTYEVDTVIYIYNLLQSNPFNASNVSNTFGNALQLLRRNYSVKVQFPFLETIGKRDGEFFDILLFKGPHLWSMNMI